MHRLLFLIATFALVSPSAAFAQAWNDGTPARLQHRCILGLDLVDQIEDLTWTWVGFVGVPRVGEAYYMRIRVGGLGCSGAWIRPEVRLPRQTSFAIDSGHPVRCFYEAGSTRIPVTDGSCPTRTSAGLYPYLSGFFAFPPTTQPYWPLPQGRTLTIEFPVVSTASLSGIQTNDYLLGAVNVIDNNRGGPTVQWSGVEPNWSQTTIPSRGAWQGVFVAGSGTPPRPRIAYPSDAVSVSLDGGTAAATTHVYVYNVNCLQNRNLMFHLERVDCSPGDPAQFLRGSCAPLDVANGFDCRADWGSLVSGRDYKWKARFQSSSVIPSCVPPEAVDSSGTCTPGYTNGYVGFTAARIPVTTRLTLLTRADSGGSVAVSPNDGVYAPSTQVTITATAQSGYSFSGWTLDGASVAGPNPYRLTMNADHQLTAHFDTSSTTPPPPPPPSSSNRDTGNHPKGGCAVLDPEPWLVGIALSLLSSRRRKPKTT